MTSTGAGKNFNCLSLCYLWRSRCRRNSRQRWLSAASSRSEGSIQTTALYMRDSASNIADAQRWDGRISGVNRWNFFWNSLPLMKSIGPLFGPSTRALSRALARNRQTTTVAIENTFGDLFNIFWLFLPAMQRNGRTEWNVKRGRCSVAPRSRFVLATGRRSVWTVIRPESERVPSLYTRSTLWANRCVYAAPALLLLLCYDPISAACLPVCVRVEGNS